MKDPNQTFIDDHSISETIPIKVQKKRTVYLVYRMSRGADVLMEIRLHKKSANERADELNRQNPHADGYYVEATDALP